MTVACISDVQNACMLLKQILSRTTQMMTRGAVLTLNTFCGEIFNDPQMNLYGEMIQVAK